MHSLLPENLSSIRELWSCPGVRRVPQRRHFRESLDVYVTVSKKRLLVSGRSVSSPEMPEWRARFRTHLKNMCIFALLLCRKAVTHRWHVNCKMSLWEESGKKPQTLKRKKRNSSFAGCNSIVTHGPREKSCFLTSINPSRIERSPIFMAIFLMDLYKILSGLGTGHYRRYPFPLKSVHVKKCCSDVASMLWENIKIKLMCTAMWLEEMDRCSNGQWPKLNKFYFFFTLSHIFINLKKIFFISNYFLHKQNKKYICYRTSSQYVFLKLLWLL